MQIYVLSPFINLLSFVKHSRLLLALISSKYNWLYLIDDEFPGQSQGNSRRQSPTLREASATVKAVGCSTYNTVLYELLTLTSLKGEFLHLPR